MIHTGDSRSVSSVDLHNGKTVLHATKRVLIGERQGAKNFAMRLFTLAEGGCSPYHTHPWEHEVFIVSGQATVKGENGDRQVSGGDFVYVPPMEEHQFVNSAEQELEFLCVVPPEGES